jgi:NAD(P)H-binding
MTAENASRDEAMQIRLASAADYESAGFTNRERGPEGAAGSITSGPCSTSPSILIAARATEAPGAALPGPRAAPCSGSLPCVRIFLAGATGVIGARVLPLLLGDAHRVAAMTRSPQKADELRALGAEAIVCDVFDAAALADAVVRFRPDAVLHELTDLPDDAAQISKFREANARMRRDGTRNLLAAARAAGARQFLAQSVAWRPSGEAGAATEELERSVLEAGGVVLRYGRLYGPGTWYEQAPPPPPRVHVDEAARRTVEALGAHSGVLEIVEE